VTEEERWHQCPWAGAVDSEDRVVVMDLDAVDPAPLVLDGVAADIWRALAVPITERELVLGLSQVFDASLDEIAAAATRPGTGASWLPTTT
jgi:hypothetical protein